MAALTTIAAIAAVAGSLAATGYQLAQGTPKLPEMPTPGVSVPDAAKAAAKALELRQRRGRASTILTGLGAGVTGSAPPGPKQVLGL